MTNDFLTALTDIDVLLILLLFASLITGTTVFVIAAFRRTFRQTTDSDSRPNIAHSTEPAAASVPTANAP